MNLLPIIKLLYTMNGFLAILLYVPQIVSAWKENGQGKSMSLLTFGGWSLGSLITALYAWFSVGDVVFTVISLGNMMGSGAIFLLVGRRRLMISKGHKEAVRSEVGWFLSTRNKTDSAASLAEHLL